MQEGQVRASNPSPAVVLTWFLVLALSACTAETGVKEIDLMPPPGVYEDAAIDPYVGTGPPHILAEEPNDKLPIERLWHRRVRPAGQSPESLRRTCTLSARPNGA